MSLEHCHNIDDLRRVARRKLPAPVFHYIDGGADDELALRNNTRAFDRYELLPSQLNDVSRIETASTLFGRPVDWPVMIAPTGASKLFHADGEAGVARAARKFGMAYGLSTVGTTTIADIAAATDGPKLFQLYLFRDRGLARELVALAREHDYAALALTVDTPVNGNRERDRIHGISAPPRSRLRQFATFARHPHWVWRAVVRKELEFVNITQSRAGAAVTGSLREYVDAQLDASLTWKDVEWLRELWNGPLVVKGIQTVEDCRRAAEAGATAVMLSNHGGRQLESAPAPVDCVSAVADALHDRLEIICDGGVRRGNHIVKALAAGANAVSIGRAYLWGLAAGGEAGVERALGILREEFERTLALVGCNDVSRLVRGHIRRT